MIWDWKKKYNERNKNRRVAKNHCPFEDVNYAWKWNDINPVHPYNFSSPIFSKLKEFEKCFKFSGTIGTFAFWDLAELNKLSPYQKEKLKSLLENEYREYTH
jgi:hypothetical protein